MLSYRKLLFGDDQPKLDFKFSESNGIARLFTERHVPYSDINYWSGFLRFQNPADIFALLSLIDIRKAKEQAPENVVTMVRVMVAHLEALLVDPLFTVPSTDARASDGLASRLGNIADVSKWKLPGTEAAAPQQRDRIVEALNVVRVLTRVLPAVMEDSDPTLETQVLWTQTPEPYLADPSSSRTNAVATRPDDDQFVIEDEDDDDDAEIKHPLSEPDPIPESDDAEVPEALGERLLRLTVDLLFCAGFTIPWTEEQVSDGASSAPNRINYAIWEAGVGSSISLQGTTRQHVSNRVEVLRLLLVLLSKSMYVPADRQMTTQDVALKFAVQELDRSVVLPLLCSLINTSVSNARNSTSSWLGLPNVGGLVAGTNDEVRTALVTNCLQILVVLLTYDPPSATQPDTISLSTTGAHRPSPASRNVFRFYLSKLHRAADFNFIWTDMLDSFDQHINASIQILAIAVPTAQSRRVTEASWQLNQVAERLIFLWRLLEHNPRFRTFVLDDAKRAPELLTILLYFSLTYKDNLALQGLVRLCAFMLQDASSEQAFAINLAKAGSAAKVRLPSRLGLLGGNTAIDCLVQGVYSLIATTNGQLSGLYAPLVIALGNTASVWRSLSIPASTRMVHLLRAFSQPFFLLSEQGNPRLLFYVLETINAVLTCNYSANSNLVYALVLGHKLIDNLDCFSLRKGVEEIWTRRRAVGTDTRDWFENAPRLEKPPLPPSETHTQEAAVDATAPSGKGKMRRTSTSSVDTKKTNASEWEGELSKYAIEVVEDVAARFIGKAGFRPTQAWVESWKSGLPLRTPQLVISKLLQEVERIAAGGAVRMKADGEEANEITGGSTDARVLVYLREQTMSDYLPPPGGGLHARPWQWSDQATIWLRSYLWGTIYVSALLPYGLWSDTDIRLFRIHERAEPRRTPIASNITSPLTDAMGSMWNATRDLGRSQPTTPQLNSTTP